MPPIPQELQQAAKEFNLVIFVGAGVSRLIGCLSWQELADAALRHLAGKGLISFGDARQLASLDAKKRITIASQISESAGQRLEIEKFLLPEKSRDSKIYEYLNGIGCAYVTTNADPYMDQAPLKAQAASGEAATQPPGEAKLVCWPSQFRVGLLRERGMVIHLHGSVAEPNSLIFTETQYLEHYINPRVTGFLQELFYHHTVLFIGYGLEEAEILEHILRKGSQDPTHGRHRFMLQGFYSHQQRIFDHLHTYYKSTFGVEIVPFDLDGLEYQQLEKIVEDWAGRLEVGQPLLADDLDFVLRAADE